MLTTASTKPNSKAEAPEFTFKTCPADPIDNEAPKPPCVRAIVSPD